MAASEKQLMADDAKMLASVSTINPCMEIYGGNADTIISPKCYTQKAFQQMVEETIERREREQSVRRLNESNMHVRAARAVSASDIRADERKKTLEWMAGQRVLLTDQTDPAHNGGYVTKDYIDARSK